MKRQDLMEGMNIMDDADLEKYLHFTDEWDMTLEQKKEYIREINKIVNAFVDQAFDDPSPYSLRLAENFIKDED